jgi:hypothetical protein
VDVRRSWLKTKNMVEGEFVLLGTEYDDSGIPWALLTRDRGGELEFAGPAILRPPSHARAEFAEKFAAILSEKPAMLKASQQDTMAEAGGQGQGAVSQA